MNLIQLDASNLSLLNKIKSAKTKKVKKILLEKTIGSISKTSKMPCYSYSIPAKNCNIGSILRKVKKSVCYFCYAMKGTYVFPIVKLALEKRLKSLKNPLWHLFLIEWIKITNKTNLFRFFDSGDLQNFKHLVKIVKVVNALPKITFWLPTKEYKLIDKYLEYREFPKNLVVRKSAFLIGQISNFKNVNTSSVNVNEKKSTKFNFQCSAYKTVKIDNKFKVFQSKTLAMAFINKYYSKTINDKSNKKKSSDFIGFCGNCKACWNKNLININYPIH